MRVKVLYDSVFQALGPFFSVIIQQHTAVVRVVSSIGLSSTAEVVIVNFQSFGPSVPYLCNYIILQHNTAVVVVVFNSPSIIFPQTQYELQYPALTHEGNFTCGRCGSILWKEERSNRYSCCQSGKQAIHPLLPVPSHIQYTPTFQDAQRSYNGLFSFTALGAGGIDRRTWTQPAPPSMLTLHGKAYVIEREALFWGLRP